jgi:hypothetical protein
MVTKRVWEPWMDLIRKEASEGKELEKLAAESMYCCSLDVKDAKERVWKRWMTWKRKARVERMNKKPAVEGKRPSVLY